MQILQRFSVTLFSVIMAIFVCNYLNVNTLKLQQISLITKSIDTYNSSNSRYIIYHSSIFQCLSCARFPRIDTRLISNDANLVGTLN